MDSTAQVMAPGVFHWFTINYSPLDRGDDNYATHADFNRHGKVPFLNWWLQQIRQHDEKTGRRSLDLLDWHLYPQGNIFSDDVSTAMAALRLRSTRILWDPTYVEESWIKQRMQAI
ncbi:MAG: glycoside hydrolase family 44 protein, partial [Ktedonobacterales bacterium]